MAVGVARATGPRRNGGEVMTPWLLLLPPCLLIGLADAVDGVAEDSPAIPGTGEEYMGPFDCHVSHVDWKREWSSRKQAWCCQHGDPIFCTAAALDTPRISRVSAEHAVAFDCKAGYIGWSTGWSEVKKAWCCKRFALGCEDASRGSSASKDGSAPGVVAQLAAPRPTTDRGDCEAVCSLNNTSTTCGEQLLLASQNRFRGRTDACQRAHAFVSEACTVCAGCSKNCEVARSETNRTRLASLDEEAKKKEEEDKAKIKSHNRDKHGSKADERGAAQNLHGDHSASDTERPMTPCSRGTCSLGGLSSTCSSHIAWAVKHLSMQNGTKDLCKTAHRKVLDRCPRCHDCSLADLPSSLNCSTSAGTPEKPEASRKISSNTSAYDCNDGYKTWRTSWSTSKRSYCCVSQSRGCPDNSRLNGCHALCEVGGKTASCLESVRAEVAKGKAPEDLGECLHAHRSVLSACQSCGHCPLLTACPRADAARAAGGGAAANNSHRRPRGTASKRYDCHLGKSDWRRTWTRRQAAWCCKEQQRGCEYFACKKDDRQHWNDDEQAWCCQVHELGCPRVKVFTKKFVSNSADPGRADGSIPGLRPTDGLVTLLVLATSGFMASMWAARSFSRRSARHFAVESGVAKQTYLEIAGQEAPDNDAMLLLE